MKINNGNQKLLGINDVTSAFMIASEMGRKFESNQTIETIVDEGEVEEETLEENEEPEENTKETSSRPGSGILPETLQEIDSDNSEEKDDNKNEEASETDISATEAEENE